MFILLEKGLDPLHLCILFLLLKLSCFLFFFEQIVSLGGFNILLLNYESSSGGFIISLLNYESCSCYFSSKLVLYLSMKN